MTPDRGSSPGSGAKPAERPYRAGRQAFPAEGRCFPLRRQTPAGCSSFHPLTTIQESGILFVECLNASSRRCGCNARPRPDPTSVAWETPPSAGRQRSYSACLKIAPFKTWFWESHLENMLPRMKVSYETKFPDILFYRT